MVLVLRNSRSDPSLGSDGEQEHSLTGGLAATGRRGHRQWKQVTASMRGLAGRLSISGLVLLLCMVSLVSQLRQDGLILQTHIDVDGQARFPPAGDLLPLPDRFGYLNFGRNLKLSCFLTAPPKKTNGYLVVRCNGGLNQQRSAICNAVLAARIMNVALVLPELDTNSFWNDKSGFPGIYDVEHFIRSLRHDVKIVESLPYVSEKKKKKMKAFQIAPPRDAPPSWDETEALAKMKQHAAIYLIPLSHRLADDIANPEYQRLRCRVNFHALRFKPDVMQLSNQIVSRLRAEGHFMAIHLRFELDMLAFAGCLEIFTPEEQNLLRKYREQNFAKKRLVYNERRVIGKCPLTPEEVGLVLQAIGFDNFTRIYLAAGDIFGGERFMKPLRAMYPHLENRSTVCRRGTGSCEGRRKGTIGTGCGVHGVLAIGHLYANLRRSQQLCQQSSRSQALLRLPHIDSTKQESSGTDLHGSRDGQCRKLRTNGERSDEQRYIWKASSQGESRVVLYKSLARVFLPERERQSKREMPDMHSHECHGNDSSGW